MAAQERAVTSLDPGTPVVVAAARSPFGTAGHSLAGVDAAGLAAPVLAHLAARLLEVGAPAPQHVVLGNCMGPGGNLARVAALAAGLGQAVPGVTVDRQCGSGQEAVHIGAGMVALGQADVVLAGGVESASTAPWRMARTRAGAPWASVAGEPPAPYDRAPFAPPGWPDPDMGPAAQAVADACGIARDRQDAYAHRSHERTGSHADLVAAEIVPVAGVTRDERPRRLDPRVLARLPGAFTPAGSVTAGNSCGVSDGAAAAAIVSEQTRARLGLPGLALLGWQCTAGDPALPGIAPVAAVRALLSRVGDCAGVGLADIAAFEITEAFAAQVLACTDALGLHPLEPGGADGERVCAWGGAIALGHPWGASGAALVVRLFHRLLGSGRTARTGPTAHPNKPADAGIAAASRGGYGLATCAIGGGQGLALLVRAVGP